MMRPTSKALLISCLISMTSALADWGPTIDKPPHHYLPFGDCALIFLTLSDGIAMTSRAGQNQSLPIIDMSSYSYSTTNASKNVNIFGATAGIEFQPDDTYEVQVGLSYYTTGNFSATGTVTEGVDPGSSDTYNYSYTVQSQQVLGEAKLLFNFGDKAQYHPYVSLGAGAAFTKVSDWFVSNPPFLTFSPQFANNNNTSFSYSAGIGLDFDVSTHWRLGAGYRFSDLGSTDLGNGTIDNTSINASLTQDHFYINEFIAQLTYLL